MNSDNKKRYEHLTRKSETHFRATPPAHEIDAHYAEFTEIEKEIEELRANEIQRREKEGRVEWGLLNPVAK